MRGRKEITAGVYRRYDGVLLTVLNIAPHTEGNYRLVIWHLDGQEKEWQATPEDVFHEFVPSNGNTVPRFERVKEKAANAT